MGKKGLGWVPDYPDVRDCTLNHQRVQGIQKSKIQNSGVSERTDERFNRLLTILKEKLKDNDLTNLTEEVEKEIDYKIHFLSASFANGVLSLESEGKEVEELQRKPCPF